MKKIPTQHDTANTMLYCGDGGLGIMGGVVFAPDSVSHDGQKNPKNF